MNKLLTIKNVVLTTLIAGSAAIATAQSYDDPSFPEDYHYYMDVSNNGEGSAKKSVKNFEAYLKQDENDPLAMVLKGSSLTLMGRDAWMPWSKLRYTENGLEEMAYAQRLLTDEHKDQKFQGMSVDLHVRSMAGIVFSQVPDFFGRLEDGYLLLADVCDENEFKRLPSMQKTYIYYYAINAAFLMEDTMLMDDLKKEIKQLGVDDEWTAMALAVGKSL